MAQLTRVGKKKLVRSSRRELLPVPYQRSVSLAQMED